MQNLNELVKMYKVTKDKNLIEQIFIILKKVIDKKADYTYYQRWFKVGKKKYIKLSETNQTTLDDVKQELYMDILKLIDTYKVDKEFDTYLFSSLWFWRPAFVNKEFMNQLTNISMYAENDKGEERNLLDNFAICHEFDKQIDIDTIFDNLTEQERNILNMLIASPDLNYTQIAETIGVSSSRISQIMENLRNKVKNDVNF